MKYLLVAALVAASCNTLAETYICTYENATEHMIDNKTQELIALTVSKPLNFVFKSTDEEGGYVQKNINGSYQTTCSTKGVPQEYKDTIVCNSKNGQFRLNTKENRYISVSISQVMDFYDTFTSAEFGTCELLKE